MQITEQKNIILIKECKDVKTVSVTKETNENVNCMNTTLVDRPSIFNLLIYGSIVT